MQHIYRNIYAIDKAEVISDNDKSVTSTNEEYEIETIQ